MTDLVIIANAHVHWQLIDSPGMTIIWVFGHIVGMAMDQIVD
jgi:hypothetical protein